MSKLPRLLEQAQRFIKDGLLVEAAKNLGAALGIKFGSTGVGIALQLILVRYLGVEEFGKYTFAWAIFLTLAIIATFGFELAAIRFVGRYCASEQFSELRGFVRFGRIFLMVLATIIAMLAALLLSLLPQLQKLDAGLHATISAAVLLLPLYAILGLHTGILRGGSALTRALLAINVLLPILTGIYAVGCMAMNVPPSAVVVVWGAAGSMLLIIAVQWLWIRQVLPRATWRVAPTYSIREWLTAAWSMMLSTAIEQLSRQLGILTIGTFVGTAASGIYAVTMRFARLINIGLQISNQSTAHMYAPLYMQNDMRGLQRIVSFTALVSALTTVPLVLILAIWPESVLQWFGESFSREGTIVLQILLIGQLINAVSGPNGVVMQMTNHEQTMARIAIIGLCCEVAGLLIFTPWLGTIGVAMAFSLAIAFRNLTATWFVHKYLHINTTIFSRYVLVGGR